MAVEALFEDGPVRAVPPDARARRQGPEHIRRASLSTPSAKRAGSTMEHLL